MRQPQIHLSLGFGVRSSTALGSRSVLWFHNHGFSFTRVSALLESSRRGNEPLPAHLEEATIAFSPSDISLKTLEISGCFEKLIICTWNTQFHQYVPSPWKPTSLGGSWSDANIKCGASAQGQMCGHLNYSSSILPAPGSSSGFPLSWNSEQWIVLVPDYFQLSWNSGKLKHQVWVESWGCFCLSSYPREVHVVWSFPKQCSSLPVGSI